MSQGCILLNAFCASVLLSEGLVCVYLLTIIHIHNNLSILLITTLVISLTFFLIKQLSLSILLCDHVPITLEIWRVYIDLKIEITFLTYGIGIF